MSTKRSISALVFLFAAACSSDDPSTNITPGGSSDGGDAQDGSSDGQSDGSDQGDGEEQEPGDGGDGEEPDECGTVLHATVRDFRFEHPDFENDGFLADFAYPGLVEAELGSDRKPVYAHPGATAQTTGPAEFAQWYNDVDGVNMPFEVEIPLADDGTGLYVFESLTFFPVDDKGFGNEGIDTAGTSRNFAFTTEIHTEFEYRGGEVFTFNGDDDLWLFINDKLAIDLGGLHPRLPLSVNLDSVAAELGITTGQTYKMDIFHAERHTDASTFRIETTIDCLIPVIL